MQPRPRSQNSATVLEIDHLGYLTNRRHRREVHANLRRAARKRGALLYQSVSHEWDGSCCVREDWPVTAIRIQAALADDGLRAAWVAFPSDQDLS